MKVSYSIRPANKHDASALAEILTESWKQAYINLLPMAELNATANREKYPAAFSIMLEDSLNRFLIAHDRETPCGMIFYRPARDTDSNGFAEIVSLYTLQPYWGKGLGQLLMSKALSEITPIYRGIYLWVFKDNTRARNFYQKNGFYVDGKMKTEKFSNQPQSIRYIKLLNNGLNNLNS